MASFLKAPKKPEQNSHIQTRSEVLVVQEVSGLYTSPFLDTDELKNGLTGPKCFRDSSSLIKRSHEIIRSGVAREISI